MTDSSKVPVSQQGLMTPKKVTQIVSPTDQCQFTIDKVQLGPQTHDFPLLYKSTNRTVSNHYKGIISLYNRQGDLARFRVFKDCDLQIKPRYQSFIHESKNDDDRDTTPTQLERAINHTVQDIREGIMDNSKPMAQRLYSQQPSSEGGSCSTRSSQGSKACLGNSQH